MPCPGTLWGRGRKRDPAKIDTNRARHLVLHGSDCVFVCRMLNRGRHTKATGYGRSIQQNLVLDQHGCEPQTARLHHGNYHSLNKFCGQKKGGRKAHATLNMPCLTIGSLFPFVAPAVAMDCAMVTNVETIATTLFYSTRTATQIRTNNHTMVVSSFILLRLPLW